MCRAREEAICSEPERRPSILSPGGGPLNRDVEDPEGSPIVLSQSNPISRGGPLFRHQEEALCADFERRVSVPSARGRPLSRGRKEALVSSPRGSCLCRAWDEAHCAEPQRRPSTSMLKGCLLSVAADCGRQGTQMPPSQKCWEAKRSFCPPDFSSPYRLALATE